MPENGNGVTRVRFDLWAVLAFLVVASFAGFSYLFTTLSEGRSLRIAADQALELRVTRLETNLNHIAMGIIDLQRGQEKIAVTLDAHERSTRAMTTMKKWQDYPESRAR